MKTLNLSGCSGLTDRGLALVARRCKLLEQLQLQACTLVTNGGLLGNKIRSLYRGSRRSTLSIFPPFLDFAGSGLISLIRPKCIVVVVNFNDFIHFIPSK